MKYRCILPLGLCLILVYGTAWAYIPSGRHILDLVVQHTGSPGTLKVEWTRTLFRTAETQEFESTVLPDPSESDGWPAPPEWTEPEFEEIPESVEATGTDSGTLASPAEAVTATETQWYRPPFSVRSEMRLPGGEALFVSDGQESIRIRDGRRVFYLPDPPDQRYMELLKYPNRHQLTRRLEQLGIDTTAACLGRFEERPIYIVGAASPNATGLPQIWIDKKQLTPIRWIQPEAGESTTETRFSDWNQEEALWFPHRITFYRNNEPEFELTATSLEINPDMNPSLFDVSEIRSIFPDTDTVSTPDAPAPDTMSDDIDAIRETIEDFRKLYQ